MEAIFLMEERKACVDLPERIYDGVYEKQLGLVVVVVFCCLFSVRDEQVGL